MHDVVNNPDGISWVMGILFWVLILIGLVVFLKSAFGGSKK